MNKDLTPPSNERSSPMAAVVILNYCHYEDTVQCVGSLRQITDVRYSVIIVDNASPDGSGEALRQLFPEETVILSPTNGGYAAGTNIGIRHALSKGIPYVFVLNPDTIVQPNVLSVLMGMLERDPGAAVATCKTVYDRTGKIYVSAGTIVRSLCAVVPLSREAYDIEQSVSYVAGCAMLIRSDVLRELGLLDEQYFMYYEDVEFSIRIGERYRIVYSPASVIRHKSGGGDEMVNYSPFYLYYSSRNRIIVFGGRSLLARAYAGFANGANILVKSFILLLGVFRGDRNPIRRQVKAMAAGMVDGLLRKTGKDPRY